MNFLEIAFIILGLILFAAGFIIPETKERASREDRALADEVVKESAEAYFQKTDSRIQENLDESVLAASNKLEREMEKISNEKLFSISEYSETVLKDINTNHSEVMFLYNMLNDKQQALKDMSVQIDAHVRDIREQLAAIDQEPLIKTAPITEKESELNGAKNIVPDTPEQNQRNRNEYILSLHQEGYENIDIARRLNVGIGEVKLVLDLFSA